MRVRLDYGRTGLEVNIPDAYRTQVLTFKPADPLPDPEHAVLELLERPTGTKPLSELAAAKRSACILVSDITRPVPNRLILPPILHVLESAGIAREAITILVGTGLHRACTDEELTEMLGSQILDRYRVENHDGLDRGQHVYLGDTDRGVPAWIDRRWQEAELKIATGLIEPHLMAGYSGGRKAICPGIVHLDTVRVWHGPQLLEDPRADCGIIDGNPVHEECTKVARMAGCDFIVNVALDQQRRITKIVAGELDAAFREGVQFVAEVATVELPEPADLVVTSSAGYPLDTTFYQSIKGLTGALPAVKQGGTIILAASMSEGIGSDDFCKILAEHASLDEFMQRITGTDYFVRDQWQLQKLVHVTRKAKVKAFTTGLEPDTLRGCFVEPVTDIDACIAETLAECGKDAFCAVIPQGPYVLPKVRRPV
jgi:nickel-dependent lactate racemase